MSLSSNELFPGAIKRISLPFKMFFKRCVIVNKEFIYFVIGNEELQNPQLNPKNLLYTGIHTYKVRKTEFKTKYGIIINK